MGLILTRKTGESITITDEETGEKILITRHGYSRFEIQASKRFKIDRTEKMEEE